MKTTILIAEDHQLVRYSLELQLNNHPSFEVVAACATGEESLVYCDLLKPDIIFMDMNLPGINGVEATERIVKKWAEAKVIGLSMNHQTSYAKMMLAAGARGYLFKSTDAAQLIRAVEEVKNGKKYFCNEMKAQLANEMLVDETQPPGLHLLTPTEMDVASFIKEGFSSQQIADNMDKPVKTIQNYRQRILKKMKLRNTVGLINFMHRQYKEPDLIN